jgi:tetratricopeptide (TPR) repeat protein
MHGREWTLKWTHPAHEVARTWLEKAIALDPKFADPLAHLATIHVVAYFNQWGENWRSELRIARELASKAFALDDLSPHAHYALGASYLWGGQLEDAIAEEKRAIVLDANLSAAYMILGMAVHYSGDSAAAEEPLETALRLDPIGGDNVMHYLALCHFMLGNLEAGAEMLRRRIAQTPSSDSSRVILVASYGHMGRIEEAQAAWAELIEVNPDYSFAERRKVWPYRNQQDPERIAEGLRKAGIQA